MNPAVLPPSYNEVIRIEQNNANPQGWCQESVETQNYSKPCPTECHKLFYGSEFEEVSHDLHGSESKSSCSSVTSSNWAVNGLLTTNLGSVEQNPVYVNDMHTKLSKDLPSGWKISFTNSGRLYYTHLATDTNHWNHPLEKTDLPPGWERILFNNDYGQYYVNHITKTAQFNHPGTQVNPISGEEHAHALAVVRHQHKNPSSTYVPPSQYLIEEIPMWLQEYAAASCAEEYEWAAENYENLDRYQTMMTRLYRGELRHLIQEYEGYRNKIIKELEERMQQEDLNSRREEEEISDGENNSSTSTAADIETFV